MYVPETNVVAQQLVFFLVIAIGMVLLRRLTSIRSSTLLDSLPGEKHEAFTYLPTMIRVALGTAFQTVHKRHLRYGPVVRIGPSLVSVSDFDLCHRLLTKEDMDKNERYQHVVHCPGYRNIFSTTDRETHTTERHLLKPAFNVVEVMEHRIRIIVKQLINVLENHIREHPDKPIEFIHLMHRFTADIVGEFAFGGSFDQLKDIEKSSEVVDAIDACLKFVPWTIAFPILHKMPFLPWVRDHQRNGAIITKFVQELIDKRRKELQESGDVEDSDFLQVLVKGQSEKQILTDSTIIGNAVLILLAGMDTTSYTMTWTLYDLMQNPEYLKRVQDEIDNSDLNESCSAAHIDEQLPLLIACYRESMRLHPVADTLLRRLRGDTEIAGYMVPKDTEILIQNYSLNRIGIPEPEKFIPERFLKGHEKFDHVLDKRMLSFGKGSFECLGRRSALVTLKLALANLFKRFSFSLLPGQDMEMVELVTFQPRGKTMLVNVEERK